ncbi:hypothetical protein Fmac_013543 [Flemingia macrophylla]|uniref:Major facilitator superfamily (MFS) profile domain-containing protein n=1 Tax=Flemingia macrophylla TaxID=520843 RepID=A0ABD1MTG4_9FABA
MAIEQHKDVRSVEANKLQGLQEPFIRHGKGAAAACKDVESNTAVENGSIEQLRSARLLLFADPYTLDMGRFFTGYGIGVISFVDYIETLDNLPKTKLLDLFQIKHVRSVVIGVGLMVCQQSVEINGIGFYTAETPVASGLSSEKVGTVAYACVQDRSLLPGWVPILAVAGMLIYIAAFSIGMGPVPWVIMSEIFPIHMKGTAGSLVVFVIWLGSWVASYTFNFLMIWSSPCTLFLYAGFSLLTILSVAKLVPEIKGKTLEEIQACIST